MDCRRNARPNAKAPLQLRSMCDGRVQMDVVRVSFGLRNVTSPMPAIRLAASANVHDEV
jgi:hypothetical protein